MNKDLKNITSIKNDGPATMTIGGNEFKFDGGNVNMGGNNITNLKSGGDVIDNAANIGDVTRISKANAYTLHQQNLIVQVKLLHLTLMMQQTNPLH